MEAWTSAMKWILIKTSLKKFFIWLKHHWQIPVIAVWSVLIYIMSRRNTDALVQVLEIKKQSYEKQIEELKEKHDREILKRDKLIEKYHEIVEKIEDKYKQKEKELSEKEKKKIKKIVEKSKGRPDVIRKEIEESFGFTYID
jgi:DNA anti-recombination protein RmuC